MPDIKRNSENLELLLDVELPVGVSFGKVQLPLHALLQLDSGSLIELNRSAQDPVEIIVNDRVIARGEVVMVDGYYGVKIQQIASRRDRERGTNAFFLETAQEPPAESPEEAAAGEWETNNI